MGPTGPTLAGDIWMDGWMLGIYGWVDGCWGYMDGWMDAGDIWMTIAPPPLA
jgi:hypothetical protein